LVDAKALKRERGKDKVVKDTKKGRTNGAAVLVLLGIWRKNPGIPEERKNEGHRGPT